RAYSWRADRVSDDAAALGAVGIRRPFRLWPYRGAGPPHDRVRRPRLQQRAAAAWRTAGNRASHARRLTFLKTKTAPSGAVFYSLRPVLVEQAAARSHPRIERRVALVRCQHHHDGAGLDPLVQVDDVLVGHADAARGNRLADIFRLVGAVDAVERVLVALEQIHR